jgi:transposase
MRQKSNTAPVSSENLVRDIRRATRKHHAAEEKIRIVLDGLRGEISIAELCRREGIAESMYYSWSKEFLEAGKRRLAGDTARAATTDEVKQLRREAQDLKEVVAEQALEGLANAQNFKPGPKSGHHGFLPVALADSAFVQNWCGIGRVYCRTGLL